MKQYYIERITELLTDELPEAKLEYLYRFLLEAVRRLKRQ